jgi:hypothetical protein
MTLANGVPRMMPSARCLCRESPHPSSTGSHVEPAPTALAALMTDWICAVASVAPLPKPGLWTQPAYVFDSAAPRAVKGLAALLAIVSTSP